MTQQHRVEFTHTHKMYRINASCECGWFKDYQISGPVAQMELKAAHDEFVMNEETMPVHEGA